jgi:negative regulator of flagellin synthesis FlgM
MRIDLTHISLQELTCDEKTRKAGAKAPSAPSVEDKTSLSADAQSISSLQAQAMSSATVRQDRVDGLRQSIQNGDYKIEPDQIAQAILNYNQR